MSVNTDNPQAPASSEGLDSLADRTSFLDIPPEAERRYLEAVQLGDAPPAGVNKPLEQNKRYNLFVKPGMLRNRKSPRVVEIVPDMPTEKLKTRPPRSSGNLEPKTTTPPLNRHQPRNPTFRQNQARHPRRWKNRTT